MKLIKELRENQRLNESWDASYEDAEERAHELQSRGLSVGGTKRELKKEGFNEDMVEKVVQKMFANNPGVERSFRANSMSKAELLSDEEKDTGVDKSDEEHHDHGDFSRRGADGTGKRAGNQRY